MHLAAALLLLGPWAQEPAKTQEPSAESQPQHVNHLVHETSPYLLQHKNNPVDWYPWGEDALERAKTENKPIFLSIGYSACHWCHVMEHECFENEEIAAYLNQHFINIKVDREERPDLDDIYMAAVQRMTGSGGWPLSVWLTPDRKPFYGGTYFPAESKYGRPGFLEVLQFLHDAWTNRREEIDTATDQLLTALTTQFPQLGEEVGLVNPAALADAEKSWVSTFAENYDSTDGGFGQAPKFPRAEDLRFLLAAAARHPDSPEGTKAKEMALFTLRRMAAGGMYDRLAGGFARYSVDAQWLIPHFEKMLYDQGTLLPAYLEAYSLSEDPAFRTIAVQTADYLLREMTSPDGAIFSATDADSEGVEGKFFVWTPSQLEEVLGPERGKFAAALYGVTETGNFEHGQSVLTAAMTPKAAASEVGLPLEGAAAMAEDVRRALYEARLKRVPPLLDDKVLTAWNGLAIDALAMAGRRLNDDRYTDAAERAADFVIRELQLEDRRMLRAYREGKAQHAAVLQDYAYLLKGLLSLFQSTGNERWLDEADILATAMIHDFWDAETGIFWDTDGRDPHLLQRLKQPWDGATPAPNAVALESLLILHALTQQDAFRDIGMRGFAAVKEMAFRNPQSFAATLRPFRWAVQEPAVAVVLGTGTSESLEDWRIALSAPTHVDTLPVFRFDPDTGSDVPLLNGRGTLDGKPTMYFCEGQTCRLPVTEPVE